MCACACSCVCGLVLLHFPNQELAWWPQELLHGGPQELRPTMQQLSASVILAEMCARSLCYS